MNRVYHKARGYVPPDAVYVGRPTKFGNPFYLHCESQRDEVCDKYEHWIAEPEQAQLRARIKSELKNKNLVCWCAPARCHADTLLRIASEE